MRRYTEKLPRTFNLDVAITEMTMQRGLYHHAVCHMDEVRQLPRPMRRVRFTPVDAPKPFADGSLGAANLDIVAIRRDENIDKSRAMYVIAPKLPKRTYNFWFRLRYPLSHRLLLQQLSCAARDCVFPKLKDGRQEL